jgi:sensor domain CHASE-containing protein
MNDYLPLLIAAISGAVSVLTALLVVRASKKRVAADATETLTNIALSLVAPLKAEIDELKKEYDELEDAVSKLKAENELLHRWSQLLFSQVVESGGEPIGFDQVQKWSNNA